MAISLEILLEKEATCACCWFRRPHADLLWEISRASFDERKNVIELLLDERARSPDFLEGAQWQMADLLLRAAAGWNPFEIRAIREDILEPRRAAASNGAVRISLLQLAAVIDPWSFQTLASAMAAEAFYRFPQMRNAGDFLAPGPEGRTGLIRANAERASPEFALRMTSLLTKRVENGPNAASVLDRWLNYLPPESADSVAQFLLKSFSAQPQLTSTGWALKAAKALMGRTSDETIRCWRALVPHHFSETDRSDVPAPAGDCLSGVETVRKPEGPGLQPWARRASEVPPDELLDKVVKSRKFNSSELCALDLKKDRLSPGVVTQALGPALAWLDASEGDDSLAVAWVMAALSSKLDDSAALVVFRRVCDKLRNSLQPHVCIPLARLVRGPWALDAFEIVKWPHRAWSDRLDVLLAIKNASAVPAPYISQDSGLFDADEMARWVAGFPPIPA